MPRNIKEVQHMHLMTKEKRSDLPSGCQEIWYDLASTLVEAKDSILDVGAGDGNGLPQLRRTGREVKGIDLLPINDLVEDHNIQEIASESWDCVLALDVIEHVEDDLEFFVHLLRVARKLVGIATPNWRCWGCTNPFHIREYTPEELNTFIDQAGKQSKYIWSYDFWLQNINPYLKPWCIGQTLDPNENAANILIWLTRSQ